MAAVAGFAGEGSWAAAGKHLRSVLAWLSAHTGLPALLVAAIVVVVGYRVLRRTARFALEVAVVAAALLAASHFGWIRW